jgi:L-rhamnose mutarotase
MRYCFALDLKNDPNLIAEYEKYHRDVWPEVIASIRDSGIDQMEIYRAGNRLFMIMETNAQFSLEKKKQSDAANPIVQKWETLMSKFQQPLPYATQGEKWMLMDKIFTT